MWIALGNIPLGDQKLFSEAKINNLYKDYYKYILQKQRHFH